MKKILLTLFLSLFLLASCTWEKDAYILLGKEPIDPNNFEFVNKYPVFNKYQRIYYILLSKEPIESEKLRLQVLKIDRKHPYFQVEPEYVIDINRGEQKHYVTDYFVLHKTGTFFIRIFSFDNLDLPLAETEFLVE